MTVLFLMMPVHNHCPVCKMCSEIQKNSLKNACPLFIVKFDLLGYNGHFPGVGACLIFMLTVISKI